MNNKKWMWAVLAVLVIVIVGVGLFFYLRQEETPPQSHYSLFSWDDEAVKADEREDFLSILSQMEIDTVYQALSSDQMESKDTETFLSDLSQKGIAVYYLAGDSAWGREKDGASVRAVIEQVAHYNKAAGKDRRFAGLMLDVEPYLLEEWKGASDEDKEVLFTQYVDGMVEAYQAARKEKIPMLLCIPWFYEKYSEPQLGRLIAEGCDGVAIMNYRRSDEYGQIETEVELARKYEKQVVNIAELQKPGSHDLEDVNTYYNEGLDALRASWDVLERRFDYDRLSFSYHYYAPLKELLEGQGSGQE
ncbi:hypothetical protein [Zongyangia hominis]|uniref:Uncharacterized protein n=1 Tax=Zongyangia hominis TaxID=2763677 RepID=A0A926IAX5_9FIRM|nr:hypothetical protein [Zongyangia hominis]MBC8569567.1 hypothetical protein [Zongyangia hominis]